jgi:outer membrane protein OmpA-like peptidoglycan-associated protein
MNDLWEFYNDAGTKWRWRRTAPNGNIVGAATEGYSNRSDCEANARRNGWSEYDSTSENGGTPVKKEKFEDQDRIGERAFTASKEQEAVAASELLLWLERDRAAGDVGKRKYRLRVTGLLSVMVVLLLIIALVQMLGFLKQTGPVTISEKSLSALKVMMVVIDPKVDEKVVVFGDTHFEFDESALSITAKSLLDDDVQALKNNPKINVRMAGYTSAKGSDEVNQVLSEQRAHAVRDYLIEQGIAPERISVIGYGRTKPALFEVTPGDDESKEALANMRVLFEIVVK